MFYVGLKGYTLSRKDLVCTMLLPPFSPDPGYRKPTLHAPQRGDFLTKLTATAEQEWDSDSSVLDGQHELRGHFDGNPSGPRNQDLCGLHYKRMARRNNRERYLPLSPGDQVVVGCGDLGTAFIDWDQGTKGLSSVSCPVKIVGASCSADDPVWTRGFL